MNYEEQQAIMNTLRNWAGFSILGKNCYNFSMTGEQLQLLSESHLLTICAHTGTHPVLSNLQREKIRDEVLENKHFLESNLNLPITTFAYPSESFNELAKEVLSDSGFDLAFTTIPKPLFKKNDPFEIGRFQVNNWSGTEFNNKLTKWLGYK